MIKLRLFLGYVLLLSSFIISNNKYALCQDDLKETAKDDNNVADSPLSKRSQASSGHRPRVSAYYPAYNSRIQRPSQINFGLYTDLIFFGATTQPGLKLGYGTVAHDKWEPLAHEFVKHCKVAHVKPRLAIGGWTGSIYFSDLLLTDDKRQQYAKFLKSYAQKFGFEGLDLDWEYPTQSGIGCNKKRPEDITNFGEFLAILRKIWPEGEFTAAMSVGGVKASDGSVATTGLEKIVQSLNYVNIMAYDVFGGWLATTGPNAPLDSRCSSEAGGSKASVVDSIKVYQGHGFKSSQIVMGIPGYGRSYTLTSPHLNTTNYGGVPSQIYQDKSKKLPPGGSTDDKPMTDVCGVKNEWGGTWRYREMIENGFLSKDGKTGLNGKVRHFDKCTGTPYLTNSTWFFSYDDEESGILKAQVVKSNALSGIFYFDTQGPTDSVVKAAISVLKS